MKKSTATATSAQRPVMVSMKPSRFCASADAHSLPALVSSSATLRSGDDQDASQAVENKSQKKEHEAQFNERLEIEIAGGFGEFIGDNSGDGISGIEERSADRRSVADDHGNGHSFAKSASESEEDGAHDTGAGEGDDNPPGGFPTRGAEG